MFVVPFTYSLQARYLVEHDGASGTTLIAIAISTQVDIGSSRFERSERCISKRSDGESVKHLETLTTNRDVS